MTSGIENTTRYRSEGKVSLWLSTMPLGGIPRGFFDGGAPLFSWLDVDYGVAIDGDFATDYSDDGELIDVAALTAELPFAEKFAADVGDRCEQLDIIGASFVVALYDCAYDPTAAATATHACPFLRFAGAFDYR